MQKRDDQERIASDEMIAKVDSKMKNARLAEIVNFAEVEIEIIILTEW